MHMGHLLEKLAPGENEEADRIINITLSGLCGCRLISSLSFAFWFF